MEPAGRLSLPVETLHHISQYLSVQDVLNLSATCHYLRDAFNDNSVWKRFTPDTITYLRTAEQHVEPKFHCEDGLTPLCESRVDYLRKIHLLNNWRSQNFVKYSSKDRSSIEYDPIEKGQVYNEKYIFLVRPTSDGGSKVIELWDISGEPVLHSFLDMKSTYYDRFYVIRSHLVVVDCMKVNVYQINVTDKTYPHLFCISITESSVSWQEEEEQQYACGEECELWEYFNIDQYLLCNKRGNDGNVFHVWDILSAEKAGAFVSPVDGFSVSLISHDGDEWFLTVDETTAKYIFVFNIKEKTTKNVFKYENYNDPIIVYKSHVIFCNNVGKSNVDRCTDKCCTVYDFKTSKEVRRRRFNNVLENRQLFTPTVVDGTFTLVCLHSLQIVDALTLETVDYLTCDLDLLFVLDQFNIFGSIFVVAYGEDHCLHFWDVKNNCELISLKFSENNHDVYLSESFSKMVTVCYKEKSVFNFW